MLLKFKKTKKIKGLLIIALFFWFGLSANGQVVNVRVVPDPFREGILTTCFECFPEAHVTSIINSEFIIYVFDAIYATSIIEQQSIVTFSAGNSISLRPGFHARSGSSFRAYIEGCSYSTCRVVNSFKETGMANDDPNLTSINNAIESIELFPNPTSDLLNLRSKGAEISSWELFNAQGEEVARSSGANRSIFERVIDVSDLSSGLYVLNVQFSDDRFIVKQLIKN